MVEKIMGFAQIVFLAFLGCGVCSAETQYDMGQAIPVAPLGIIGTTTPTYEWTAVPGATRYCLLVEDNDGVPVYLAWYTAEEADCADIEGTCKATPNVSLKGDMWSVVACLGEECGGWGPLALFEFVANPPDQARDTKCQEACMTDRNSCMRKCNEISSPFRRIQCANSCRKDFNSCIRDCR